MAKTYEIYHNDAWVPATFIKEADADRIWIEYDHVEDDEDGVPKEAVKRQINVLVSELKVTE
jgi:hypothetical protein